MGFGGCRESAVIDPVGSTGPLSVPLVGGGSLSGAS